MKRKRYDEQIKSRVGALRGEGRTYSEIQKIYAVPKSTLSVWLGKKYAGIFDKKAQYKHLQRIRLIANAKRREQKNERISSANENARRDVDNVPIKDVYVLKAMLSMLYWAEGSKHEKGSAVIFANTDPELALLFVTLLRQCFSIDELKMRVRIHIHHYHNRKETIRYWSRSLNVPIERFGKVHVKKRSVRKKFRRNFMGICFIIYHDAQVRRKIIALAYEIGKRIASIPSAGIEPASFPPQGNILSIERRGG